MRLKPRYFMAPEGDPPTGGAPAGGAPAAQATAATPAQGNAPAAPPAFDVAALAREVAAAVAPTVRDSVFAELRRSGALPKGGAAPAGAGAEPQAHAGVAAQPGAVDIEAMLDRRESFASELGRFEAPASAVARARAAFKAENPADVHGWARAYATDMGWKERAAPSAAASVTTTITPPAAVAPGQPAPPGSATPPPPIAASDTAPGAGDPLNSGELIDVSKLTDEQRRKLGPDGIRRLLERSEEVGSGREGRPPTPAVLRRKA